MSFTAVIDLVDDTSHGGGFSASGGTCDQNHSLGKVSCFHNSRRNVQILRIRQIKCNNTDDSGKRTTLPVCIYTKSWETWDSHGKVIVTGFQHRFYIPVVSKLVNDPDKFICLRRHEPFFKTIQRTELSVNFYRKGTTGNNKYIRGFFLSGKLQKSLYFFFHKIILLCRRTGCCPDSSLQLQPYSRRESRRYCCWSRPILH